jgi:transcriptional regulator with XRE-family HTH domain
MEGCMSEDSIKRSYWLRDSRLARGLTQTDLGRDIGISVVTVNSLERDKVSFTNHYYDKFQNYFTTHMPVSVPPTSYGDLIKSKRLRLGMSQIELMRKLGYDSHVALWYWETNRRIPGKDIVCKLKELLKLTKEEVSLFNTERVETRGGTPRAKCLRIPGSDCEWLTKERLARGLSQLELSELVKCSREHIMKVENNIRRMTPGFKRTCMHVFQKWDKRDGRLLIEESPEEMTHAASREESIPTARASKQSLAPVRAMAAIFQKSIPSEIKADIHKDTYATRDKNFISELMLGKINKGLGDVPLKFLNLPYKGREIGLLMTRLKLDMKHSLGMDKDTEFVVEIKKLFMQRGWNMPVMYGDINKHILDMKSNPFNLAHLDYCGCLTEDKLQAINHLIRISRDECMIFVTLNTNPRCIHPVFYELGKPPFNAPIAWHQPYFGSKNALMEVFMIHLNPAKTVAKTDQKTVMVPVELMETFTKRGWETITKLYLEADTAKRMEIFNAVSKMLPINKEELNVK